MSKNNEKWDRSGYNELIREDKQKTSEFKKGNQYRNIKDSKTNEKISNNLNGDSQKKHFTSSNNNQASYKINNNDFPQETPFKNDNNINKPFNYNYFNFKQRRRKNNPSENSQERKLPEKFVDDTQSSLGNNDSVTALRGNQHNSNNNLKRQNFNKGGNINRNYDGKKKLFNRNRNFYLKNQQDNEFYRHQMNFVPQECMFNPNYINLNMRNPPIYNPVKNTSYYPNNTHCGLDPLLYNNNNNMFTEDIHSLQNPYVENALKNEVKNEMSLNKKPFKKYVEEIIKSNNKKNSLKLNINNTYISNYSKAKSSEEEFFDNKSIKNDSTLYNYSDKVNATFYPMINNEYNNMMYSKFPTFFPYGPMYNPQNLNMYLPNKAHIPADPSNYIVPPHDKGQMFMYQNPSLMNNYFNYMNQPYGIEVDRDNFVKNIDTHNTTFTTVTTRTDLINTSLEIKELEDEKETGKSEKKSVSSDISKIEEEKNEINNNINIEKRNNLSNNNIMLLTEEINLKQEDVLLMVNIKLQDDLTASLTIRRYDDVFSVTKSFCKSNNLNDTIFRAIYIKIVIGLSALKELKESDMSDSMITLLKRAYSIYMNSNSSLDGDDADDISVNNEDPNNMCNYTF